MTPAPRDRSGLLKTLGPGLVWAATAVGVSHLVQSTRAGAVYGFALVGVVIFANLLKYPFFEYGPRYAAATGESLLEGYARLGRWAVWIYLLLTVGTMFTVVGAVTFVTGGLATQLLGPLAASLGFELTPFGGSAALLLLSAGLLLVGRYPLLDGLIKAIIVVLTLSTVAAVVAAAGARVPPEPGFVAPSIWTAAGFAFLIALVGWMPSAVDISVWHSLWTLERSKQTGYRPKLSEALFDFNLGYLGTAFLALIFLALGALVFFGRGAELPTGAAAFAAQLVEIYTQALGRWARPLIMVAAFTTMFSTTLACTDAFPRVLARTTGILLPRTQGRDRFYWLWMAVVIAGALLLISVFRGQLTLMVDVATTLSFLTSPILGWFNFRVVTGPAMPAEARPPGWLRALSWAGLAFGVVFGLVFLSWRFLLQ